MGIRIDKATERERDRESNAEKRKEDDTCGAVCERWGQYPNRAVRLDQSPFPIFHYSIFLGVSHF